MAIISSGQITLVDLTDTATYIYYADNDQGGGATSSPVETTKYMGIYSGPTLAARPEVPDASWGSDVWTGWMRYVGEDGKDGKDGEDGTAYYTWIKYSNSANPTSAEEMSDDPTGMSYMGIAYNQTEQEESNDPTIYKWSLIKGADGTNGTNGEGGLSFIFGGDSVSVPCDSNGVALKDVVIKIPYSALLGSEIIYSLATLTDNSLPEGISVEFDQGMAYRNIFVGQTQVPGSWYAATGPAGPGYYKTESFLTGENTIIITILSGYSTWDHDRYILTFKIEAKKDEQSQTIATILRDFNLNKIVSGSDGQSQYFHIKYSNDGLSFTDNEGEVLGDWMGTCVTTSEVAPTEFDAYTWSLIKGQDGTDGVDGQSQYFHVKYSNDGFSFTDNLWAEVEADAEGEMIVTTPVTAKDTYFACAYSWSGEYSESYEPSDEPSDEPTVSLRYGWVKEPYTGVTNYGPDAEYVSFPPSNGRNGIYFNCTYDKRNYLINVDNFGDTPGPWMGTLVSDSPTPSTKFSDYTWHKLEGTDGSPGQTSYFHIKYSDVESPTTSDQLYETPNLYIGTYVDFVEADSDDPTKYSWAKFVGQDGQNGVKGEDGQTYYLHIKYSNDNGQSFTGNDGEDSGTYMGVLTNTNPEASLEPGDYTWSLIKGADGIKGEDGKNGISTYFHVKYSDVESPTSAEQMYEDPRKYIGTYVDNTEADSTNPSDYKWVQFMGTNGTNGIPGENGKNGETYYLHIKYSDDGGNTLTENDGEVSGKYIGVYTDTTQEDSLDPKKYTWSLIKGTDGINGQTSYFHVKYSNDGGNSFTDNEGEDPGTYIGVYTDMIEADSENPGDYKWSLIKGTDGTNGTDGLSFIMGTSSINVPCSGDGIVLEDISFSIPYTVFLGADKVACRASYNSLPPDIDVSVAEGTTASEGLITISFTKDTDLSFSNSETIEFTITAIDSGKSSEHTLTYVVARQGKDGEDAITYYTWIKYSNSATPTAEEMSDEPDGKSYIGIAYNQDKEQESNNPTDYKWSLIKGTDGESSYSFLFGASSITVPCSDEGVTLEETTFSFPYSAFYGTGKKPATSECTNANDYEDIEISITKGYEPLKISDGVDTWYGIHIIEGNITITIPANYNLGLSNVYLNFNVNAVDLEQEKMEFTNVTILETAKYTLTISPVTYGKDGQNGTSYYTWIAYADDANGSNLSKNPTKTGGAPYSYLGIAHNQTTQEPEDWSTVDPQLFIWSLIKGADGDGADDYYIETSQTEILKLSTGQEILFSPETLSLKVFRNDPTKTTSIPVGVEQVSQLDLSALTLQIFKADEATWVTSAEAMNTQAISLSETGDLISVNLNKIKEYALANASDSFSKVFMDQESAIKVSYNLTTTSGTNTKIHSLSSIVHVRYGMTEDMAKLSLHANGIVASVSDAKLKFSVDGLTIENGNFKIIKTAGEGVKELLYADEEGNLVLKGNLQAAGGTFAGTLEGADGTFSGALNAATGTFSGALNAATGSFDGTITARNGDIGGFRIEEGQLYSTDTDRSIILNGSSGEITAKKITLGIGAKIEDYLLLGENAKIQNPTDANEYSFISVSGRGGVLKLTSNGTMLLGSGDNSILLDGAEGSISSQSFLNGQGWKITNKDSIFNDVTVRGSIKASVLEYGKVQAIGGMMFVRPSSRIKEVVYNSETDKTTLTLESAEGFVIEEVCLLDPGNGSKLHRTITEINKNKVVVSGEVSTDFIGEPIVNLGKVGAVGIGLNGSVSEVMMPSNAISVLEHIGEGTLIPRVILGKLPEDKTTYGFAAGTYGLYAENVLLRGSLVTQTTDGENVCYSGISTLYSGGDSPINPHGEYFLGEDGQTTASQILLWAGANGDSKNEIQNSKFLVDRNGNLYASSGYFKGTIITDATITASTIKTAVLEGTGRAALGEAALTIQNALRGIVFKSIDETASSDVFSVSQREILGNVQRVNFNNNFEILSTGEVFAPSIRVTAKNTISTTGEENNKENNIYGKTMILDTYRVAFSEGFTDTSAIPIIKSYIDFQSGLKFYPDGSANVPTMELTSQWVKTLGTLYVTKEVKYGEVMEYRPAYDGDTIVGYDLYITDNA